MSTEKPPAVPLFDCTTDPATRDCHVAIRMPHPEVMCINCIDMFLTSCGPFCVKLFWVLVRGMRWAFWSIGCFMLLAGVPMLACGVYVPVLYSVLALLVLSVLLSAAFLVSVLTTEVKPDCKDRERELVWEFVGRVLLGAIATVLGSVMCFLGGSAIVLTFMMLFVDPGPVKP